MIRPHRPPTTLPALALAFLALVFLAGCGDTATAQKGTDAVHTDHITMPKSYRFDPPLITVPAGTTVTWTNTDNFTHSVQVAGGAVQMVAPGASTAIAFDTPGEYPYLCTLHAQNMKGKVIVTPR